MVKLPFPLLERRIGDPLPPFAFCPGFIAFAVEFPAEHDFPLIIFTEENLPVLTPLAWVHKRSTHLIFHAGMVEILFPV